MILPSEHLETYLLMGLFLLVFGLYSMMRHRTFIGMLIAGEFLLNGASLNFLAFNRFLAPDPAVGQIFTLMIMGLAAAEAALIVSLVILAKPDEAFFLHVRRRCF